ncbi:MAG: phosphoenolpyruvate synthase, partial [Proteobacteria bacterium]
MIISSHAVNPPVGQMGGKAKNLHFLSRHGIAVPRWFCLSVAGFEAFIATYQTTISKIISTIDFDSYQSIQTAAEKIQKFFVDAPFPAGLREAIQQTLATDLKGAKFMSVRSSALSEDSGKDSFAGQMDTFLYVSEAELEKHIRLCWASAFGAKVLTYTNARGIDPLANRVSVVIQEMFDSDVSGVLFTVNPSGILHEMLIVGGYGIGEGIVSDQVETDSFV